MDVLSKFEVDAPIEEVWELLLDIPRVIPCMPGAELIETVDDERWKARLSTRLGPMSLGFDVDVTRESVDDATRAVTLKADAKERSGRGGAAATIVNSLEGVDGVTVAHVKTDLFLTGPVARFGRQGLVRDMAEQMTDQFASNLRRELGGVETEVAAAAEPSRVGAGPSGGSGEVRQFDDPSIGRMVIGLLLRRTIRRLQGWLVKVEGNA